MKKQALILLASLAIASSLYLTGCISPKTVAPAVPPQPATTNETTGAITPAVPGAPAQVLYVVSPKLAQISSNEAAIYQQYAPIAGAVYPPAQPILTVANEVFGGIMALLTSVSVLYARKKNKQAVTASDVAKTVIQGVEAAGAAAATIKQSIAKTAIANGNADHVENAVNAVTGHA